MTLPLVDDAPGTPSLVARTTAIPDPGDLAALVPADVPARDVVSWLRDGDGLIGWGRAASVRTTGEDRFEDAEAWWRQVSAQAVCRTDVDVPGSGPIAFGSFAFSPHSDAGAALVIPAVVVGRRDGVSWVTHISPAGRLSPAPRIVPTPAASAPGELAYSDGALTGPQWTTAIARTVELIQAGDVDKVVMARDVQVEAAAPIGPQWLVQRLSEQYANTWTFSVDGLIGATPEMLVRREKGLVMSRILAGTIQRTGNDERDLALAGSLARSSKDLEEHEYAVRSVADALRPHCTSMNVPESPFVLHLPNVMHLATDVAGVLDDRASSLKLAAALHPSAAVCGTPTAAAAAVIEELEHMDRGRYAGPVGWMDTAGDGEWGIALRCGALDPHDTRHITIFAGCGVVAGSEPDAELAESEAKLLPMRDALTSD
ncbi:isochorismate synthase [Leekyejoonella antrihumi]|uniref:isochorismate synthase n=1 Tax=Leekyejoonella antrihumi TaxID=1660198 RepID=A0A563E4Z0_9MICO|nr:isochorismate synthase [Leekyejoonella antrihumi]TWP37303.1 isochorismate synthase [Leekyejoonella antrihumi]